MTSLQTYRIIQMISDDRHSNESVCGLAEQSRTRKWKVVSSSPVSANMFVSLGKILNLACLVDPSDIWVAVMGDVTI